MQPSEFRIERSTVISAAPADVFAQVNDLKKFNEWSPWAKLDPNAKSEFGGTPEGEGATLAWAGNQEVGKGKMTIIESRPHEHVRMRLDFKEPMEDTATAEFLLKPEGDGTHITWALFGHDSFFSKVFLTFIDRDTMVGDMYEKGLGNLKRRVEGS